MSNDIVVRADVPAVAREAAERVVTAAEEAVGARGRFTFALAGGATPAALYALLASAEVARRIAWQSTQVFFGDERCVGPDHEWSNYALAQRSLLGHVPLLPQNVHRIRGEDGPDRGADAYARVLAATLAPASDTFPRFDLVLLGMGDDGHTASLFPGMPALLEQKAWVVGTGVPDTVRPRVDRVTLTLPVLNAARDVLFLVTGSSKAPRLREVLEPASPGRYGEDLPAARVRPREGTLTWLLDGPAAALLGR